MKTETSAQSRGQPSTASKPSLVMLKWELMIAGEAASASVGFQHNYLCLTAQRARPSHREEESGLRPACKFEWWWWGEHFRHVVFREGWEGELLLSFSRRGKKGDSEGWNDLICHTASGWHF